MDAWGSHPIMSDKMLIVEVAGEKKSCYRKYYMKEEKKYVSGYKNWEKYFFFIKRKETIILQIWKHRTKT